MAAIALLKPASPLVAFGARSLRTPSFNQSATCGSVNFDASRLGDFPPLVDLRADQDAQFLRRRTDRIDSESMHFRSELRRVDDRPDIIGQYFQDGIGNAGRASDEGKVARAEAGIGLSDGRNLGRVAQSIGTRSGDQLDLSGFDVWLG